MNTRLLIATMLVFFLALGVGPSVAGNYHGGCGAFFKGMDDLDANQDELLTLDEFATPHMESVRGIFKMLDTNNDEVISAREYEEFMAAHGYGTMKEDKELIQ